MRHVRYQNWEIKQEKDRRRIVTPVASSTYPPTWATESNLSHYILHYRAFNKNIRTIKLSLSIILTAAFRNYSREILRIDQAVCIVVNEGKFKSITSQHGDENVRGSRSDSLCFQNLVVINWTANKTDKINTT